ncbi:MAG: hypothetical protein J0H97_00045 [Alphaproteobacteria bacterium]|nr:hypothetical protein [Alphaproteobacteria bacterium]
MTTTAAEPLPDDVETLKAMLRAKRQAHRAEMRNQVLQIEKLEQQIAQLRHERFGQSSERRALLDQAHQHAAGEVLVGLHDVDIGRLEARHVVELRRHRGEARCAVERRVVDPRAVAMLGALLQSQVRRRQQLDRAFQMGEVDRLAPLTADLEREVVQLARYEALVQQREAMAQLEDALQPSLFDAGDSFMKLPETHAGRPDILDTMSPVAPR